MPKHYLFAGIDLMISRDKKAWFIEANAAPFGLMEYKQVYGHCKPLKDLVRLLNPKRNKIAIMCSKNPDLVDSPWVANEIKKYIKYIHVCIFEDNKLNFIKGNGQLIDKNGNRIKPDILLRQNWSTKRYRPYAQERAGIKIINPVCVLKITKDKMATQKVVKKYAKGVNCPAQFAIKSKREILPLIKRNKIFKNGFILKPKSGSGGRGIFLFCNFFQIPARFRIKEPYILSQKILPYKIFNGRYFDIRAYVIGGKYSGALLRVSRTPITNILRGAKPAKIRKWMEKIIKPVAEKVVKAIDIEADKIKKTYI